MKRLKDILCAALVLFMTAIMGCLTMQDYGVAIQNVGSKPIRDAHVMYGTFYSVGGYMAPGRYAGHGFVGYPIPEKASVEWRTEDQKLHKKEVDVKKLIPKGISGYFDIIFSIDDNNNVSITLRRQGQFTPIALPVAKDDAVMGLPQ